MSDPVSADREAGKPLRHRAGLFDIRTIIGLLLGIYGVILVVTGFFTPDAQVQRSDGLNLNIWAGLGMVVVGAAFVLWARLRPIVVPEDPDDVQADVHGERPATH